MLDSSARQALVEQAAGKSTRQVEKLLAGVDPELTAPADRIRPLGADRWELKAVIDDDCRSGLEQLKGLLSHVDPHLTLGQFLGRAVREAVERHDPARPPRGRRTGRACGDARCKRNFGAEGRGRTKRRGGATDRHSGGSHDFGGEGARFFTEGRGLRTRPATAAKRPGATTRPFGAEGCPGPDGALAGGATSPAKAPADTEHRGVSAKWSIPTVLRRRR